MKRTLYAILALVLALGLAMSLGGCPPPDDGEYNPALVAMTDGETTTICVRNIPPGGVTGGTDHGFCSSDPEEQDEWHFVLIGLNASAVPGGITTVFVEDTVVIGLENYVGAVAHYRLPGYLNATLVGACAQVEDDEGVLFLLSHAPCGETQPVSYDLTTSSTDGGSVTVPGEGVCTYDAGTVVDLVATPETGYRFSHWSGDVSGTSSSTSVTMNSDKSVTANFVRQYTLTMAVSPAGAGTTGPGMGSHVYDEGTVVDLSAAAGAGYRFSHWSGDAGGTSSSTTVTMDGDKTVTATFTQVQYTLTVNIVGNGSVGKVPDQDTYTHGTNVQLTATADPGWTFSGWSGDLTGSTNPATITMDGNKTVTATFAQYQYTLTVNTVGSGSVGKVPDQATYTHGTSVQLTATADPGWTFSGWSGDLTGSTNPATITMDGDKTVTATFTQVQYTLTVNIVGNGSVGKAPDQDTYTHGTSVQLTATAEPGWTFSGWSGDLSGMTNPDSITMEGNKTVTATFTQYQYTLTVNIVGNGSVGKAPDQATYTHGTSVQLTATAAPGWTFTGWSGDLTGSTNPDNITMDGDKTVTVTFTQVQYTLTYIAGIGGTISGTTPQTVNHGGSGTAVAAVPNAGYQFVQWSDGPTQNPRTDTNVTGDKSVTANFAIKQYTLTYSAGAGGTLSGTTAQTVSHGGSGTAVTAVPNAGYQFVQWSDGSMQNRRTDTNVTADKSVTADFEPVPVIRYSLTVSSTAGGYVSIPGEGTFTYDAGTVVVLRATAYPGYQFSHWSGHASSTSMLTTVTMLGSRSVRAHFAEIPAPPPSPPPPPSYTLTISSTPGGSEVVPGEGTFTYEQGTVVSLVAEADEGYRFVEWVGDVDTIALVNAASTTITIEGNHDVVARFERGVGGPAVRIAGVTRGVDGAILSGADVVLYHKGEAVANTVSDEMGQYYATLSSGPGSYDVMVSADGFQNEARPVSVSELTATVLDFVGDYGLIPRVPSTPYVLACMSLWKLGEPPLQLSTSKMLQVISAWLHG